MESLIGAIFMDGGWHPATKFVTENWRPRALAMEKAPKDPKTELQEMAQHYGDGKLPIYEFVETKRGHTFHATVTALGKTAEGTGTTKKSATADAARNILAQLTE